MVSGLKLGFDGVLSILYLTGYNGKTGMYNPTGSHTNSQQDAFEGTVARRGNVEFDKGKLQHRGSVASEWPDGVHLATKREPTSKPPASWQGWLGP
jgi:hypothetical protein